MQGKELEESENSNSEGSPCEKPTVKEDRKSEDGDNSSEISADFDSIIDVSGKSLDFPLFEGLENARQVSYIYKNVFNLIPSAVGAVKGLKSLKFFGNELNLFPLEFNDFLELECLQLKVPEAPGLGGLDFGKLKDLKELELSRVPLRPSTFHFLTELSGLECLTKLSVCHFSIRYLPPEIGRLSKLEYLDLSFNKMRKLPSEITYLNSLISLKAANNKLVELPSGLCSLQNLENLDLSNNRLTSLGFLELGSMHNLRKLNLQFNKLLSCCQIPSWICCNLEGNGKDMSNDEFISSSAEMDVLESVVEEHHEIAPSASVSHSSGSSPNNRCFAAQKSKGWKRCYSLQQRARQERLNSRRKGQNYFIVHKTSEKCIACRPSSIADDSFTQGLSTVLTPQFNDQEFFSGDVESKNSTISTADNDISLRNNNCEGKCTCDPVESLQTHKEIGSSCSRCNDSSSSLPDAIGSEDECLSFEVCGSISKSKRHSDRVLDNPKPSKYRRPTGDHSVMSSKYSSTSVCSIADYLPDGFYDAGRDRPFMPLSFYEKNLHPGSREVILVDRTKDERLDAVALCAQALVSHFLKINGGSVMESGHSATNTLQIVYLLVFFVSDHFGGSGKNGVIQKTRKAVLGSNCTKPFVCTCSTGNEEIEKPKQGNPDGVEDIFWLDLFEKSIQSVKARRNSIVVPLGSLKFGVCRHRALLMKYLCDRLDPPIPCELVRGFLDFSPHAWNVVAIRRGKSWVRMIVDACHPYDIREEKDPEYFCRYVPLSRVDICDKQDENSGSCHSFPSPSARDEIGKSASSTLFKCKVGSHIVAAKVRKLEISGASADQIKKFEFTCLGEVRILGSLKHPCIVKYYGHQISYKWTASAEGNPDLREMQSSILMEYIKGGSLKCYLERLTRAGEKHVPAALALFLARDVAFALTELHAKNIIHRDIKSENIFINLDEKKDDGSPIVKLGDFDCAIPLRSSLHSCCIAHIGIPPPDICVGTSHWMAPEVLRTIEKRDLYGLEVDIWSFGCVLLELLTLQMPYSELPESDIPSFLEKGERPKLTEELEELTDSGRDVEALLVAQSQCAAEIGGPKSESKTLRFLVAIYRWCTEKNPADRPTARELYELFEKASLVIDSRNLEQ